jgi:hypothetical protein
MCCYILRGIEVMNTSLEGNVRGSVGTLVVECSEPREIAVIAELASGVENEVLSFRAEIAKWASAYARQHQGAAARDPRAAAADLRRWSREHFLANQAPDAGVGAPAATRPEPADVRAA